MCAAGAEACFRATLVHPDADAGLRDAAQKWIPYALKEQGLDGNPARRTATSACKEWSCDDQALMRH
jgi:hypothetical protein